ncbi:hypothetical protein Tco_0103617 [Tanacetum coccineum]
MVETLSEIETVGLVVVDEIDKLAELIGKHEADQHWFGNGSSSGCHGGLWWLIMDEEEDEVIVNIWREFIGME